MQGKIFLVNENHIKLLKEMNVSYHDAEYGAPCIDPKKPYGNGNVPRDLNRIIMDNDKPPSFNDELEFGRIHAMEMPVVLQILLHNCHIEVGEYVKYGYGKWEKR